MDLSLNLEFGSLPSAKYFAECFFEHSAKKLFVECHTKPLGKRKHSVKRLFAECFIFDTRQRVSLPSVLFFDTRQRALCRVFF
jgi:hypothetical protein